MSIERNKKTLCFFYDNSTIIERVAYIVINKKNATQ
jgi:hypothetical protein